MGTIDRVRQILSAKGLTLYRVSQQSAEIFGRSSPYFIPQRLYFELAAGGTQPSIHQLVALSRFSNHRLCDWMAVFGFHLDDIPQHQLGIPRRRTVLLDSSIYDGEQWTPWFADRLAGSSIPEIAPLGQILKLGTPRRAKELLALSKRKFLYATIGVEDVFGFPTLAPGSIARIDVQGRPEQLRFTGPVLSHSVFLVQNGDTLNCGHLRGIAKDRFVLCSAQFPFTQVELTLGRGVSIVGVVDAEIRPLAAQAPEICAETPSVPRATSAIPAEPRGDLGGLLRRSRIRVGLTFREASSLSRSIANALGDQAYFIAGGTLSDYENLSAPPRHIQKIISLCVLYCIDFWTFLRAGGLPLDALGKDPLPDEIVGRRVPPTGQASEQSRNAEENGRASHEFLASLIDQWEELPLFLKNALPPLNRLKNFSLSDIFWVGGNQAKVHPCLAGAAFVAVNRRAKTPAQSAARTAWEQPLYVLLGREGRYLCLSLHTSGRNSRCPAAIRNGSCRNSAQKRNRRRGDRPSYCDSEASSVARSPYRLHSSSCRSANANRTRVQLWSSRSLSSPVHFSDRFVIANRKGIVWIGASLGATLPGTVRGSEKESEKPLVRSRDSESL
jgi:hypothetical protein